MGWITSTTRPGTSIGAQNARGLFFGLLDVELDVLLRAQVDPEVAEGDFKRGHHLLGGKASSQAGARKTRATSQRSASLSPTPARARNSLSASFS